MALTVVMLLDIPSPVFNSGQSAEKTAENPLADSVAPETNRICISPFAETISSGTSVPVNPSSGCNWAPLLS